MVAYRFIIQMRNTAVGMLQVTVLQKWFCKRFSTRWYTDLLFGGAAVTGSAVEVVQVPELQ